MAGSEDMLRPASRHAWTMPAAARAPAPPARHTPGGAARARLVGLRRVRVGPVDAALAARGDVALRTVRPDVDDARAAARNRRLGQARGDAGVVAREEQVAVAERRRVDGEVGPQRHRPAL